MSMRFPAKPNQISTSGDYGETPDASAPPPGGSMAGAEDDYDGPEAVGELPESEDHNSASMKPTRPSSSS
jgi:hypothetical protein